MHLARKFLFVLFLPFCIAQSFAADQWPAGKPIRLIVPFPAGGGADTIIRTISDELSRNIGQKIIIENRPGAGGCLGTEYALKGKADGRTLLYVTNGTLGINPSLYPKIGYDALNDIEPVARLTEISLIMAVNPQRHDVKSLQEFLSCSLDLCLGRQRHIQSPGWRHAVRNFRYQFPTYPLSRRRRIYA